MKTHNTRICLQMSFSILSVYYLHMYGSYDVSNAGHYKLNLFVLYS